MSVILSARHQNLQAQGQLILLLQRCDALWKVMIAALTQGLVFILKRLAFCKVKKYSFVYTLKTKVLIILHTYLLIL